MQLGDWVEFETIVIKEQTATGSRPATRALAHPRRGMVIGARQVYDVEAGAPPTLSHPQMTLLVAVSLHRCYRVFPADARPAQPPAPSRPRQRRAQSATGVTIRLTSAGGAAMNGRMPISQSDLELLVADQINQRTAAGDIFTAYDITLGLRDANPACDIPHDAVRRAVHGQMEALVQNQLYASETASFGSDSALRYLPA